MMLIARAYTTSYWWSTVTLSLFCTISEILPRISYMCMVHRQWQGLIHSLWVPICLP